MTTFQDTVITTTGTLTINDALNTSNNDLTITASSVVFGPGGSINTGTGTYSCTGVGCFIDNLWNVDASGDWMTSANWSLGHVPRSNENAILDRPASLFTITLSTGATGNAAQLQNNEILNLSGSALNLTSASTNSGSMTLSSSTLAGAGSLTNQGALSLSNSSVNTSLVNQATGALTANGTSAVSGQLSNAGTINVQTGTLQASNFPTNAGAISIASGAVLSTNGASFSNASTGNIQASGTLNLGSGDFTNSGNATFGGAYNVSATNVLGGVVTLDGTASTGTLTLSGGTVNGTGNLTVTTDFNQTSGNLGTTFTDLALTKSGDFSVGALQASHDITLTTTGGGALTVNGTITAGNKASLISSGAVLLNNTVSASGTDTALVIAGTTFTNRAGNAALAAPNGRWLVYAADPATSTFGNLDSGNTAIWNATYGTYPPGSVTQMGNRYLFAFQPTATFTSTDAFKRYGEDATSVVAAAYSVSGLHPGVVNAFAADSSSTAFSGAPSVTSVGSAPTANTGTYGNTASAGTLSANNGYALTFASPGVLTVSPAPLTVTANSASKTYGQTVSFNGTEFTASGLQNGEAIGSVSLASAGAAPTANVSGSPYPITASNASGSTFNADNYTITYQNGVLTVRISETPAAILLGTDRSISVLLPLLAPWPGCGWEDEEETILRCG